VRRWPPAARRRTRGDQARPARALAARDIADELASREVALNLGGSVHDPTDAVGRLVFNVLAMVAEFESDLICKRTREGMAVARAAGKLRRRRPKLTPRQEAHRVELHKTGAKSPGELGRAVRRGALDGLSHARIQTFHLRQSLFSRLCSWRRTRASVG
jgi:DNA invertase Pin-like site-specific DNA recombinase